MSESTKDAHVNVLHGNRHSMGIESMGIESIGVDQASQPDHALHPRDIPRTLEEQCSRLPSDIWLVAAGASIAASMFFQATDQKQRALFVGHWAPTFLLIGIYNKLAKPQHTD